MVGDGKVTGPLVGGKVGDRALREPTPGCNVAISVNVGDGTERTDLGILRGDELLDLVNPETGQPPFSPPPVRPPALSTAFTQKANS
jgi:hypothetical protein